jgi:iron complex transport system substrate-binding protein
MLIEKKHLHLILLLFIVLLVVIALLYWQAYKAPDRLVINNKNQETISITDCTGRTVQIPAEVKRVVCLSNFPGQVAVILGQIDKIAAAPDGFRQNTLLNEIYPGIKDKLLPVTDCTINTNEILKANPDVVFLKKSTAENSSEVKKLNQHQIPYLVIDYTNIKEQQQAIMVIARALDVEERGQVYNDYYQNAIDRIEKVAGTIPTEERLRIYHADEEVNQTDSPDSLPADWITKAGAINVSLDQPLRKVEGKYSASLEQIFLWNPDVILVNEPDVINYIASNPRWSSLKAVKGKRVYQMPIGVSLWGHSGGVETPLATMWTAQLLYPEYFKDINIKDELKDYYHRFLNYQVSDEMLDHILNAEGMRGEKKPAG